MFTGSRFEKTKKALVDLGPAIANAGVTTFLAVIILPFSSSHVFLTFFKIFGLTVVYGVFHGLLFLPMVLSTLGQDSIIDQQDDSEASDANSNNNTESVSSDELPATQDSKSSGTLNPVFTEA